MAKPQKENGYTPIANEILDNLIKLSLNGTQWRIIVVVWRYTYGFSRKEHELSVNFILNALELNSSQYNQIARGIKSLLDMSVLVEVEKPQKNNTRKISFNKNYDLWTKKSRGLKSPEDELVQRDSPKKSRESLTQLVQKDKQIYKTNIKTNIYSVFEYWNSKNIITHKKLTDKIKRKISSSLETYTEEDLKKAIDNYNAVLNGDEFYWSYKWTLEDFLQRGIEKFLTEVCFQNYKQQDKQQQAVPANKGNYDQRKYPDEEIDKLYKEV